MAASDVTIASTVPTVLSFATKEKSKRPQPSRLRKPPKKYTVAEAFNFLTIDSSMETVDGWFHQERCIRAVAFLLHYCGEREDMQSPIIADGLGYVLDTCATDLARAACRRETAKREG